jgi:hypothetical protein
MWTTIILVTIVIIMIYLEEKRYNREINFHNRWVQRWLNRKVKKNEKRNNL